MANQRQRLARKRLKEEHPELFPTLEPRDPNPNPNPNKKNKKKIKRRSSLKRKKPESIEEQPNNKRVGLRRKHPLRVDGMKPWDSCFICKSKDHIAKFCPQKALWEKDKICLVCRQRGHTLKRCPNKSEECVDAKLCYNCGETGHSLFKCPKPLQDGGTKFASCFVCHEQGHLSKDCPQNSRGIYPKGGCCKICGGVTHLAKDCPDKGKKGPATKTGVTENEMRVGGQVTKFVSGDELDDFAAGYTYNIKKNEPSTANDMNAKLKKKQGPKEEEARKQVYIETLLHA